MFVKHQLWRSNYSIKDLPHEKEEIWQINEWLNNRDHWIG